jgi:putative heme-binding domain-containing protein
MRHLADGRMERGEVSAAQARQLAALGDAEVDKMLAASWGAVKVTPGERLQEIADWRKRLTPEFLAQADMANGHNVFLGTCAACHRMHSEGGTIGPDLTGSGRTNLDYLLENILAPNAVVAADFLVTRWELSDGRIVAGALKQKANGVLTIQTPAGEEKVEESRIRSSTALGVSLMPEGLAQTMGETGFRDLLAWLMKP